VKTLKRLIPGWKAMVGIMIGVIVLRKIENMFPQTMNYTRTGWPFDRLMGGNG